MYRSLRTAGPMPLAGALFAASTPPALAQGPPEWLKREMSELVADGGRWITDNSAYLGADEPFDQYGLEWAWGLGEQSITGRLFGLRNGSEVGTFWQFRMFWHPGTKQAVMMQWGGDGRLGEGPIRPTGMGVETESMQDFHAPDGSRTRVRHLTVTENGEHRTRSFDEVNGEWVASRTYLWKRAVGAAPAPRRTHAPPPIRVADQGRSRVRVHDKSLVDMSRCALIGRSPGTVQHGMRL